MSCLLNIAKLALFIEEDETIRVKGQLKHSKLDYNAKHQILLTGKHPVIRILLERTVPDNQHERGLKMRKKHAPTKVLDHWIKECVMKDQSDVSSADTGAPIHSIHRSQIYNVNHSMSMCLAFAHTGVDYLGTSEAKLLRRRSLSRWCLQNCRKVIAILDNQRLADEVLSTTMCLVEQTLDARPLTAVDDNTEDLKALTANYFLLARENAIATFMPTSERCFDRRTSFKAAQTHVQNLKEGE